jgi:pimeloyl-ACP methyl ester carboxylesterase
MILTLYILLALALILLAGTLYQILGSRNDRRIHTGQGRWATIAPGCSLYLFEQGAGEPTVIFESGIGATHLNWRHIQDAIAPQIRTVAYDRAGLGWSDRSRTARTPSNIARELHRMLQSADIHPPYILVGHSFGGLIVRRFAILFPAEVAGVLLVDPMRCEQWPPLDPSKQSQLELGQRLIRYALPAVRCGLARLLVRCLFCRPGNLSDKVAGAAGNHSRHVLSRIKTEVGKMPRKVWPAIAAHWSRPGFYAGMRSHIESIPDTVREMHVAEPIIDAIPVAVLTPGSSSPLTENQLTHIADNVRQIVARKSEHWIHLDEPELVIDCICKMAGVAAADGVAVQDELAQRFEAEFSESSTLLPVSRSAR